MTIKNKKLKFIDLFSGIGGFHLALSNLGHECVFAAELKEDLRLLYHQNFGITPISDIKSVRPSNIPSHDILCAGFPCQPFSKAGEQLGVECPKWGDLFECVANIIDFHRPKFFILENVPNLIRHDKGRTWKAMEARLHALGYADVRATILSPHMFGVPQARDRAIIIGAKTSLIGFKWPGQATDKDSLSIKTILDDKPVTAKRLPPSFIEYLDTWQQLIDRLPKEDELPSFPIWAMEFGASYPYENDTPYSLDYELSGFRGKLGQDLTGLNKHAVKNSLPSYASGATDSFPSWKKTFIKQNRLFYKKNQTIIDDWLPNIQNFASSFQKLEWNWKGGDRNIYNTLIQFRASGIRIKRPTVSPSLVALTTSQVPVIGWERRYMSPQECARLQSMERLKHIPSNPTSAFKAFGNAVNVKVIQEVANSLIRSAELENDSSFHVNEPERLKIA